MKINVFPIIKDHLKSLKDERSGKLSIHDIIIFYLLPLVAGFLCFYFKAEFDRDSYNVSITFFGIFIALLLNIQVAIFSIYLRKWKSPETDIDKDLQNYVLRIRRTLLNELNNNISYLVLVCCISLIFSLIGYILKIKGAFPASISVVLYTHFLLTMLMIVKRAHALFRKEYAETD